MEGTHVAVPDVTVYDRQLLVSYQPDKRQAAQQLATAFLAGIKKLTLREGVLVAQLDELVLGADEIVADAQFLPPEPVALCLTGTPRLVAAVRFNIATGTKARFVVKQSPARIDCLRVGAFIQNATITIDTNRYFAPDKIAALAPKGWDVIESRGEDVAPGIYEAVELLDSWASGVPTPWAPPAPAEAPGKAPGKAPREAKGKRGGTSVSSLLEKYATRKSGVTRKFR
jgi:hypothetical protein